MCIAFLMYYPRMTIKNEYGDTPYVCGRNLPMLSECNAGWNFSKIMNVSDMGRVFGSSQATCPISIPSKLPSQVPKYEAKSEPPSQVPKDEAKSEPSSFATISVMSLSMIYLTASVLAELSFL